MKCLSLWQPWATLMAHGAKRIETRSWCTHYRGELAIHSAQTRRGLDNIYYSPFAGVLMKLLHAGNIKEIVDALPFGAIVGIVDLYDVRPTEHGKVFSKQERAFGDFGPGRYAWFTRNARTIDPIVCRGEHGLFDVDREIADLMVTHRPL